MTFQKKNSTVADRALEKWEKENREKIEAICDAIKELREAIAVKIQGLKDEIDAYRTKDYELSIYSKLVEEKTICAEAARQLVENLFSKLL